MLLVLLLWVGIGYWLVRYLFVCYSCVVWIGGVDLVVAACAMIWCVLL